MSIYVYDNRSVCVMDGEVGDNLAGEISDKIDAIKVDGIEYVHACRLLNRKPLPAEFTAHGSFIFVGDDARTVYLNW